MTNMKTLTQVWLTLVIISFFNLILGFQLAGRIGLFVALLVNLFFIYMILHRGLEIFKKLTKASLVLGSDMTGFKNVLDSLKELYGFSQIELYTTTVQGSPLVWSELSKKLVVFIHEKNLTQLATQEKILLAHLVLAHGQNHTALNRRLIGLLYVSLQNSFLQTLLNPFFNILATAAGLKREWFWGDNQALKMSQAPPQDLGLLLHKLHYLTYNQNYSFYGAEFFSILSNHSSQLYKLKIHPKLPLREKQLMGFSL